MKLLGYLHNKTVFGRRVKVLSRQIASVLPDSATILDVGCGDGTIDSLIMNLRPDVTICGIDVLVRKDTFIPVTSFDGLQIPYGDNHFDAVLFIDVLHHTVEPERLLMEAKRVSKDCIILKDHTKNGFLAGPFLRFMDWIGNAPHGVVLPYNYWTEQRWNESLKQLGLSVQSWKSRLDLYPWPVSWLFDRSLHFVAKITKK